MTAEDDRMNGGAPPRIDPTSLTTNAVDKAKEDLRREIAVVVHEREIELTALREFLVGEIRRVDDVTVQKFDNVDDQFVARDRLTDQAAREGTRSLDAALAAAKEAVGKSEITTKESIAALGQLMDTQNKALEGKFADLKERVDKGQAGVNGARDERTEHRAGTYQYTSIVTAIILAVAAIGATLIGVLHH